ncbi:MAG: hypothetical protein NVS3B12_10840 [Acidimicrobiales bacterium]
MKLGSLFACFTVGSLLLTGCSRGGPATGVIPLRQVARVALPGDTSRIDYASLDLMRHRLFIAHLGQGEIIVVDTQTRQVLARIPAPGVHGLLAVPSLAKVFASASDASQELTIDAGTLTVTARARTGDTPDGVSFDPKDQRVFVSDETGGDVTVLDASSGASIGTVVLGGEAGNNAYDPQSGRILVDDQTHDTLDEVDPAGLRVTARHHLHGCDHAHGLALDVPGRRAFVACDANNQLLTVDLATFAVTDHASTGSGPDVLTVDTTLGRLYVAAESGDWAVFDINRGHTRLIARRHLAGRAHTFAVDPSTHIVYVPLADAGGHPALEIFEPR